MFHYNNIGTCLVVYKLENMGDYFLHNAERFHLSTDAF